MRYIKKAGVYQLVCTKNGRRYIGCSTNLVERGRSHIRQLRRGNHSYKEMQKDYNKYGETCFRFYIIQQWPGDEKTNMRAAMTLEYQLILFLAGDGCYNKIYKTMRRF